MIQDIQSSIDTRSMAINRVGIRRLKLPMLFSEGANAYSTVGEWGIDTDLSQDIRGTHMSRLVRFLHDHAGECTFSDFCNLPALLLEKLPASRVFLSVRFTGFIEKTAPISKEKSWLDSQVRFESYLDNGRQRNILQVTVPVTSLCPCSKAISKYGAHNQRSHVILSVEPTQEVMVRDLIAMAETGASCELFSLLKRSDERYVTETAFENPKFVEDIVRDLAVTMSREEKIINYRVEAENFESIHNHSAYALIESDHFPIFMLS